MVEWQSGGCRAARYNIGLAMLLSTHAQVVPGPQMVLR